MKTIQTVKKPEVNLKISEVQLSLIHKVLSSATFAFDENNKMGDEFCANESFVCVITQDEFEALHKFFAK